MIATITTDIIIVSFFSLVIGYAIYHKIKMDKKQKRMKKRIEESFNRLTKKQSEIIEIVNDVLGIPEKKEPDVVIVRDEDEKIPQYGNKTWKEFEDRILVGGNRADGAKASYDYSKKLVLIRGYELDDIMEPISTKQFTKLYIHEAIHSMGYIQHTEEMANLERKETNKILKKLKNKGFLKDE